jgi:hypothetical protein
MGYRHSSLFFLVIGLLGILTSIGLLFLKDRTKRKLDATSKDKQVRKLTLHSETSQSDSDYHSEAQSESEIRTSLITAKRETHPLISPEIKKKLQIEL